MIHAKNPGSAEKMIHIVDDDELILAVISELGKTFGFQSRRFRNPLDYLALAGSSAYKSPAAVFCDVVMPEMNGFDMMHQVHELHPNIRFVMISGKSQSAHPYCSEACIFLVKPISFGQMEKTFQHLRTCNECGPAATLVNAWPDNRDHFATCKQKCHFDSEI